jgi:hypothetical protein
MWLTDPGMRYNNSVGYALDSTVGRDHLTVDRREDLDLTDDLL